MAALADVERQSRRAEQQSELALKTLNSVVFNIQGKLTNMPGLQEVRRSLIGTAIDGLRKSPAAWIAAPKANHALIVSHMELGDIFLTAGGPKGVAVWKPASNSKLPTIWPRNCRTIIFRTR